MKIKLIVSDIDGTVVDENRQMPLRNVEKIKEAQAKGIAFAFATGRTKEGMYHVAQSAQVAPDYAILTNGSEIIDGSGQSIFDRPLSKKDFLAVCGILQQYKLPIMFFTQEGHYSTDPNYAKEAFLARDRIAELWKNTDEAEKASLAVIQLTAVEDLEAFYEAHPDVIKVETFFNDLAVIDQARQDLAAMESLACLSSDRDNIEITSVLAQKGLAIEWLMERLGLTKEQVIVIGDSMNDLSMFQRFPLAFAPDNALEAIKAEAYQVVSHHNLGAVADAIEWALHHDKKEEEK